MLIRLWFGFAVLLFLSPVFASDDSELMFALSSELGYKELEFQVIQLNGTTTLYKPNLLTLQVGLTGVYKDFYISVAAERTLAGEESAIVNGSFQNNRFERNEDVLTFGYQFFPMFSGFVGYLDTNIVRFSSFNSSVYGSHGPFAGLGYSQSIAEKGTLSASIAYAKTNGRFTRLSGSEETFDADASGFSYSLAWSAPMGDGFFYRVGFKVSRYDYDTVVAGVPRTAQQNYNGVVLAVTHFF